MAGFQLQGVVNEEFKMMGLSLRGDAMTAVMTFLHRSDDANAALSQILDVMDTKALSTSIVSKETVDDVVSSLDRANGAGIYAGAADGTGLGGAGARTRLDEEDDITVVDAFSVPRFNYDTQRRVFHENASKDPTINAEAESKIELYRERFLLLQQRIMRHRMFVKPTFNCGAAIDRVFCEITPLTGLLGNANETRYVMGCLSQLEDDRYFLEDLTARRLSRHPGKWGGGEGPRRGWRDGLCARNKREREKGV